MLKALSDELINMADEGHVTKIVTKCRQARLPQGIVAQIERDAHYPQLATVALKDSLPRVTAKYLNQFGVSAEYKDEMVLVGSMGAILAANRQLYKRLEGLIEKFNQQQRPPAPAPPQQQQRTDSGPQVSSPVILPDPPRPPGAPPNVTAEKKP